MLRAHATSARAQSLLGIRGVRGERHPSTSLENNDAPESAAARSAAPAAARSVDGKRENPHPRGTAARRRRNPPSSGRRRRKTSQLEVLLFVSPRHIASDARARRSARETFRTSLTPPSARQERSPRSAPRPAPLRTSPRRSREVTFGTAILLLYDAARALSIRFAFFGVHLLDLDPALKSSPSLSLYRLRPHPPSRAAIARTPPPLAIEPRSATLKVSRAFVRLRERAQDASGLRVPLAPDLLRHPPRAQSDGHGPGGTGAEQQRPSGRARRRRADATVRRRARRRRAPPSRIAPRPRRVVDGGADLPRASPPALGAGVQLNTTDGTESARRPVRFPS